MLSSTLFFAFSASLWFVFYLFHTTTQTELTHAHSPDALIPVTTLPESCPSRNGASLKSQWIERRINHHIQKVQQQLTNRQCGCFEARDCERSLHTPAAKLHTAVNPVISALLLIWRQSQLAHRWVDDTRHHNQRPTWLQHR